MSEVLHFRGFIRGIHYRAYLAKTLKPTAWQDFDVNNCDRAGLIDFRDKELAYSIWVSPKRTRSYPFARIYNTYNASKKITIIPILKDEGKDGDRDRLQYSTFSWMNLLNTYVVLGYYSDAERNPRTKKKKITNQKFDNSFVRHQIEEIANYHQSALHWNRNLLDDRFTQILECALAAYDRIAKKTSISLHSREGMDRYLQTIRRNLEKFKDISLKGSQNASRREAVTSHALEHLVKGRKATFAIENYLGGIYYLTPDEIILDNNDYIIQESKNNSKKLKNRSIPLLPGRNDILDGLFKLILFSNIDCLTLNNQPVNFSTRLKLTSTGIRDKIILPQSKYKIQSFLALNNWSHSETKKELVELLNLEARQNSKLQIEISGN